MIKKLPLFYFKPTICWIDDNRLFLEAANNLFKEEFNCLMFQDPSEAVKFLSVYESPCSKINCIREFTESELFDVQDHLPVDINISEITNLSSNISIRNEIAILLIDNCMPEIKGIDICNQFKYLSCKKILLTGETSPIEAIDAFNDGIIDKFIPKDKNFTEKLRKNIFDLTLQFFSDTTASLLSYLETARPSPLSDQIFVNFFIDWFKFNNFKEFYLINKNGSFLVKDAVGNLTAFIVMSETAIKEYIKVIEDLPDSFGKLKFDISEGKLIPFFGIGKECWQFNHSEWEKYLYAANTIQGREKYFWSIVKI